MTFSGIWATTIVNWYALMNKSNRSSVDSSESILAALLSSADAFWFVLADTKEKGKTEFYPSQPGRLASMVTAAVRDSLQHEKVQALFRPQRRAWLVVAFEDRNCPPNIGSEEEIRERLWPILRDGIEDEKQRGAVGFLFPANAHVKSDRQLIVRVLRLPSKADAITFCDEVRRGQRNLSDLNEGIPPEPPAIGQAWNEFVEGLVGNNYESHRNQLLTLSDGIRGLIARRLEPLINAETNSRPANTYEEKKELAKWVNAELRRFGLALKAPGIKEPCFLVAHPGNHPEIGRFQLDYTDENRRHHRTLHSVKLPQLELMLDDLTRAPYPNQTRRR